MAIIHIDTKDLRSLKALQLLVDCGRWAEAPRGSQTGFWIPSQTGGSKRYFVTDSDCQCQDWQRHAPQACKHMQAVQIHLALRELAHAT